MFIVLFVSSHTVTMWQQPIQLHFVDNQTCAICNIFSTKFTHFFHIAFRRRLWQTKIQAMNANGRQPHKNFTTLSEQHCLTFCYCVASSILQLCQYARVLALQSASHFVRSQLLPCVFGILRVQHMFLSLFNWQFIVPLVIVVGSAWVLFSVARTHVSADRYSGIRALGRELDAKTQGLVKAIEVCNVNQRRTLFRVVIDHLLKSTFDDLSFPRSLRTHC